jgi:hypothetical protein
LENLGFSLISADAAGKEGLPKNLRAVLLSHYAWKNDFW